MRYDKIAEKENSFPLMVKEESSEYSPNKCIFRNDESNVWLYHANCIEFMDLISIKYPDGIFDMIFADPPYFLSNGGISCHAGKMVKVDKGQWDKSNGPEINHEFNTSWLSRCQKLLKPNGTIWVSGTHHVIHSVGYAMQQLGMKILNDITWEKPNPPPNLSCRYFTHSTETIIWAAKNEKSKHCFNYDRMREINSGKQMKSVWRMTSPNSNEKGFGKHPTQKPVQLIERIILASTIEGNFVFDPFSGSSTTGVAAIKLKRKFVGCELEAEFLKLSSNRLEMAINGISSSLALGVSPSKPRQSPVSYESETESLELSSKHLKTAI
jgi:site-specific DNA-methyltransferase (adenine-specific)